jgi:Na+/H+ antiporter NhaA
MFLFLANLAFEEIHPQLLTQAKLGVLATGVIAAGLDTLILRLKRLGRLASDRI